MYGFQAIEKTPEYRMKNLIPIDLQINTSGNIEGKYGVFSLTKSISDNIHMILQHPQKGDCHYFTWAVSTGTIAIDTGRYPLEYLEMYGLENIGYMRLKQESIRSEYDELSRKLSQLESSYSARIVYNYNEDERKFHYEKIKERLNEIEKQKESTEFQNPWFIEAYFSKYNSAELGDLFVKMSGKHHSMIYLGDHTIYGPIFLSRIGGGGDLSIHTFGQISEYFHSGAYSIYRKKNDQISKNNQTQISKIPIAEGDYSQLNSIL